MRKLKRKDVIVAAVALLAGVAVYLETRSWRPVPAIESPRYLRAKYSLTAGHPVGLRDFAAPLPDSEIAPEGAFTDQDWHLIEGRKLRSDLPEGSYLTENLLQARSFSLGKKIPRGLRAYPIEAAGAGRVQPGDRIDLLSGEGGEIVAGAQVLARPRGESEEIVLLLTPRQIQLLEKSKQSGKLTVALRNPEDFPAAPLRGERARRGRKPPQRIELWSEAE